MHKRTAIFDQIFVVTGCENWWNWQFSMAMTGKLWARRKFTNG